MRLAGTVVKTRIPSRRGVSISKTMADGRHVLLASKNKFIGRYDLEEDAATAHDKAIFQARGDKTLLNFDITNYLEYLSKFSRPLSRYAAVTQSSRAQPALVRIRHALGISQRKGLHISHQHQYTGVLTAVFLLRAHCARHGGK
jgi:hypothetical protein